MEYITKSRIAALAGCQRLHKHLYIDGVRALTASDAQDFGTMFGIGLDGWWERKRGEQIADYAFNAAGSLMGSWLQDHASSPLTAYDMAKARTMLAAYDARWEEEAKHYEVLAVEKEFVAKIPGMYRVSVAGKMDKIVRDLRTGEIGIVDHKTTSADISPESSYWPQLRLDFQVSLYLLGARSLGYEPSFFLYDVVSRPTIKPLQATPIEARKYTQKDGKLYAGQREHDETVDEFETRLAEKVLGDLDRYLVRARISRSAEELAVAMQNLQAYALIARNAAARESFAPQNPSYCFEWGRACEFFDACANGADINDPIRYRKLESLHPELSLVQIRPRQPKEKKHNGTQGTDPRQPTVEDRINSQAESIDF